FDALYSVENRGLPRFPASLTTVVAAWTDSSECRYEVDHLDDLRSQYDAQATASSTFYGREPGGRNATFEYRPGPPLPRASATVTGPPDEVESMLSALRSAFPNPFDGLRLFLS